MAYLSTATLGTFMPRALNNFLCRLPSDWSALWLHTLAGDSVGHRSGIETPDFYTEIQLMDLRVYNILYDLTNGEIGAPFYTENLTRSRRDETPNSESTVVSDHNLCHDLDSFPTTNYWDMTPDVSTKIAQLRLQDEITGNHEASDRKLRMRDLEYGHVANSASSLQQDTVFLFGGDHGCKLDGSHGGDSFDEVCTVDVSKTMRDCIAARHRTIFLGISAFVIARITP